ncbi:presequence translocase-associated motor subunit [Phlyctema vagabunda]|uniref:Presequence translocated-associated motor subunit PAM17 n=1 Tax=Phlyctema vagabunda TaxID=108571 RepID=A0ABR4P3Q9_9HELO
MICTAPNLRTAAIGCRVQPALLTASPYHTASPSPRRSQDSSSPAQRRAHLPTRSMCLKQTTRSASSTSNASTSTSSQTTAVGDHLDWNTFFKLRKTRRWYQLGSSVGTGINGVVLGAQVLSRADMDPIVSQIPLDPFITLGMITFACGGLGWLAGPSLGTAAFNYRNRKFKSQMDAKEKEFYGRVKKYRVDPSASSMANPVPDYYAEKVGSVQGYRQWLKDQRAFNKKRTTYIK